MKSASLSSLFAFTGVLFLIFSFSSCTKDSVKTNIRNEIKKDSSNFEKKQLEFITSDNLRIRGELFYSSNRLLEKEPLIILIHQFLSDRKQWGMDFIDSLIRHGYKVLTYDIRGHGESDKIKEDIKYILTDKNLAPLDLESIFKWLKKQTGIDSMRIGIVGTSIGASLGLYARFNLGAKTLIGISGGKNSFEALTGIDERTMGMGMATRKVSSVYFICGNKDDDYARDEQQIMENFVLEPKEIKIFDSDKHGKELIEQFPGIKGLIIDWFKKNL